MRCSGKFKPQENCCGLFQNITHGFVALNTGNQILRPGYKVLLSRSRGNISRINSTPFTAMLFSLLTIRWSGGNLAAARLHAWLWRAHSTSANDVIKVVTAWLDVPCDELPTLQKCYRARAFSHDPSAT
jgi:hypothetical protein